METDYTKEFSDADGFEALIKTFYDEYPDDFATGFPFSNVYDINDGPDDAGETNGYNHKVKGQIAYSETYVPDLDKWLTTVNYYDREYRVVQTTGQNHLGGLDIISNKYNFVGNIIETKQEHYKDNTTETPRTIEKRFAYDHTGCLETTEIKQADETGFHVATNNNYNELGQLTVKNTHKVSDDDYLFNSTFAYNIRGWMTNMGYLNKNDEMIFNLGLFYNNAANPQFNGNIGAITWNSSQLNDLKTYNYACDGLSRILTAEYTETDGEGHYNTTYSYDKNGNIQTLNRDGLFGVDNFGQIDMLDYAYKGNQLIKVNDNAEGSARLQGFTGIISNNVVKLITYHCIFFSSVLFSCNIS